MNKFIFFLIGLFMASSLLANSQTETKTSEYFNSIKQEPTQLLLFLQTMPKGGDLHNHRSGSTYAENLLNYGLSANFCINPKDLSVYTNPTCPAQYQLKNIKDNTALFNQLVDAWSMRDFVPGPESTHDHFFETFLKYLPLSASHRAQTLTEIVERAGAENEIYLETMITTDNDKAIELSKNLTTSDDLATLYTQVKARGTEKVVADIQQQIDNEQNYLNKTLHCHTPQALAGCQVTQRYQYTVFRDLPPEEVFAQLIVGFELANKDPRVVAVNIVGAEDGYYTSDSFENYELQMKMFEFLHDRYSKVKIDLHAGELALGLVPPEQLKFHIKDALNVGHANRIGHGVDIAYEENAEKILQQMQRQQIAVEISLTSNAMILGVAGNQHPFSLYLSHQVPIVLSTDDEGVLRTNLTHEYLRAIQTYNLPYLTVKNIARNSITYNFLDGASLWQDPALAVPVTACAQDELGGHTPGQNCQAFLNGSNKAKLQWQLETKFNDFEKQYI